MAATDNDGCHTLTCRHSSLFYFSGSCSQRSSAMLHTALHKHDTLLLFCIVDAADAVAGSSRCRDDLDGAAPRAELTGVVDGRTRCVGPQVGLHQQVFVAVMFRIVHASRFQGEADVIRAGMQPMFGGHQLGILIAGQQILEVAVVGNVPAVGTDALHLLQDRTGGAGRGDAGGYVIGVQLAVDRILRMLLRTRILHRGRRNRGAIRVQRVVYACYVVAVHAVRLAVVHRAVAAALNRHHNLRRHRRDRQHSGVGPDAVRIVAGRAVYRVRELHIGKEKKGGACDLKP